MQLLREINHENVVKLVNVHINHVDMSLYLAFDYAEHDLYVCNSNPLLMLYAPFHSCQSLSTPAVFQYKATSQNPTQQGED